MQHDRPPDPPDEPPQRPLPIVLGVTGHCHFDAASADRLENAAKHIFQQFHETFPHSPLLLLSSLAEGADQLITRVALQHGVELVAPLPLDASAYAERFTTTEAGQLLEELLSNARSSFVVPAPDADAATADQRDELRFRAAGEFIASHCQVMIALWDGQPADRAGSTAAIVNVCREGFFPTAASHSVFLDEPESRPVLCIHTPRDADDPSAGAIRLLLDMPREQDAVRQLIDSGYGQVLKRIDAFNADALKISASSERSLPDTSPFLKLRTRPIVPGMLVDLFQTADELATRFARSMRYSLYCLLSLVFCAAVFFHLLFSKLFNSQLAGDDIRMHVIRALFVAMLVAGMAMFIWIRRKNYEQRYLDYRALAEGLRVQIAWCASGIFEPVTSHYLRKPRNELQWIRAAIATTRLLADGNSSSTAAPAAEIEQIRDAVAPSWVRDQQQFYARRSISFERRAWLVRNAWRIAYITAVIVALINITMYLPGGYDKSIHPVTVALSLSVIAVGLWRLASQILCLNEQAKQYKVMANLFDNAETALRDAVRDQDASLARNVLMELGREALAENGEWLVMHRERPIELPKV